MPNLQALAHATLATKHVHIVRYGAAYRSGCGASAIVHSGCSVNWKNRSRFILRYCFLDQRGFPLQSQIEVIHMRHYDTGYDAIMSFSSHQLCETNHAMTTNK